MKVPTYSKYGLRKFEVEKSDERDRKVSKLLTHTLPLMSGGVLGVIVFLVYFFKSGSTTAFQFFYQIFLFGTIGIICVGIPMAFFVFTEKVYYWYMGKRDSKYQAVQQFKSDRSDFDFWKIRKDTSFWQSIDGLSIEKEVLNIYMYLGYELKSEFETSSGERDHVITKDDVKLYLEFKTDAAKVDEIYLSEQLRKSAALGADKLVVFSKPGFTKPAVELASANKIEILTISDVIKKIYEIH